ncbi:MAG: hypothetical protein ACM37W_24920 [Actinomycetota bacterium]
MMRLLAGVKATVLQADRDWNSGTLRLVAILVVENGTSWSIDLVTKQPPQSDNVVDLQLAPDALIQLQEGYFCRPPCRSEKILHQLKQTIQTAIPEKTNFIKEMEVELLEPGDSWQSTNIYINLQLKFLPDAPAESTEFLLREEHQDLENETTSIAVSLRFNKTVDSLAEIPLTEGLIYAPTLPEASELFKNSYPFASSIIIRNQFIFKRYLQWISEQELLGFIFEMQEFHATQSKSRIENLAFLEKEDEIKTLHNEKDLFKKLNFDDFIPGLINSAYQLIDLTDNSEYGNKNLSGFEMKIADLTLKLLWHIIRSSYEIMQLVGGVKARVLQPTCEWETGTLRLMAIFQVNGADSDWKIDVGAGQLLQRNLQWLVTNAIVQSDESGLCKELVEIENLLSGIIRELRTTSPEIGLWMDGVAVDLRLPVGDGTSKKTLTENHSVDPVKSDGLHIDYEGWQSRTAQVMINFEWIPDSSPSIVK